MSSWTALKEGFDAFTRQLPVLLGAYLVVVAVQQAVSLLIPESLLLLEFILDGIVTAPLVAGQYLIALKVVRKEPVVFKELFAGLPMWGPIVGSYLLYVLLSSLATLALIIPGIMVGLMLLFAPIRFLDPKEGARSLGAIEALRESARITRGYKEILFGIGFLLGIPMVILVVLQMRSLNDPRFPAWIIEIISLLSGALFFGPVAATSYMVVYDHALNHPRG